MRLCEVEGCNKKHYGRGMCKMHMWRHDNKTDPRHVVDGKIEWLDSLMQSSDDTCIWWPYGDDKRISINGKRKLVFREICERRNGPPPTSNHHAAHSCGMGHKGCVNPKHLSWKTAKENDDDKDLHGTRQAGVKHAMAILTDDQVRYIRSVGPTRADKAKMAEEFGVSYYTLWEAMTYRSWKHLE